MDKETMISSIAKLEKGLVNKHITDSQKEGMKVKIAELQAKVAALEDTASADTAPADDSTDSNADDKEPAKKADKPKAKKKPKEHKEAFKTDCDEVVKDFAEYVEKYNLSKKPKVKRDPARVKRTSEVLADGIAATAGRAIKRELALDKVVKIKVAKLKEAKEHFSKGLSSMRSALGGISSDNDTFITDFDKQFDEWIDQVIEKQKAAEDSKAAA